MEAAYFIEIAGKISGQLVGGENNNETYWGIYIFFINSEEICGQHIFGRIVGKVSGRGGIVCKSSRTISWEMFFPQIEKTFSWGWHVCY